MNSRCQSLSVAAGSLLGISTCGDFVVLEEEKATTGGWRIHWNTQFWKEATRSILLFIESQRLRLVEFLHPANWLGLLLTCLCSLAVLRRTCVLDMVFISTGHWKRRGFSWERSVHFPLLSHGEIQQISSRRRTRQKKESFFSSHYTFFLINHPQSCHDRLYWLN